MPPKAGAAEVPKVAVGIEDDTPKGEEGVVDDEAKLPKGDGEPVAEAPPNTGGFPKPDVVGVEAPKTEFVALGFANGDGDDGVAVAGKAPAAPQEGAAV